jgi:AcrR family transcriptional regulator
MDTATQGSRPAAGYRRSVGTPRAEARRRDLLERVTEDLVANGLVDFSLRRAARAAGTTHKVLLYHFEGLDDLLRQAVLRLREKRISGGLAAAAEGSTLADRVRAIWSILSSSAESAILDQAIGLSMYDPDRYAELSRGASRQYLPALSAICPDGWSDQRRLEVAEMILGALRGFLVDLRTSGDEAGVRAGLAALGRALDREEAAGA